MLTLFARQELVTAAEIGALLPIGARAVRGVITRWVAQGFLELADPSNRARSYRLPGRYRQYLDALSSSATPTSCDSQ